MFRIKEYPKGFVVEYKYKGLFKYKWRHFISVSGMSSLPWYFSSYEAAEKSLLKSVKWMTIKESNELD